MNIVYGFLWVVFLCWTFQALRQRAGKGSKAGTILGWSLWSLMTLFTLAGYWFRSTQPYSPTDSPVAAAAAPVQQPQPIASVTMATDAPPPVPVTDTSALAIPASGVEGGYKGFRWGQSYADVAAKVPDLTLATEGGSSFGRRGIYDIYVSQHGDLYSGSVPDPTSDSEVAFKDYKSEGTADTYFSFADDELIGVEVTFFKRAMLNDLKAKYGETEPTRITGGRGAKSVCVWKSADRIILWSDNGTTGLMESVYYLNKAMYERFAQPALKAKESEDQRAKSKLD